MLERLARVPSVDIDVPDDRFASLPTTGGDGY